LAIDRTLNDAALDGNYAATLKSRADHTDRVLASQDCVITVYTIDFIVIISVQKHRLWSNRRTAAAGIMAMLDPPSRRPVGMIQSIPRRGFRGPACRVRLTAISRFEFLTGRSGHGLF
jgi:hypothetical protein